MGFTERSSSTSVATLCRVQISKLRGTRGNKQKLGNSQRGTLAGRVTAASVHDGVVVFGSQFEDFGTDGLAAEFGTCIAGRGRVVFLPNRSEIGCGFLVVGVHEQDISILSCSDAGEISGDGSFAAALL